MKRCRYVSDHAFDGYKSYCQHKLLDGPEWAFVIPRAYPPSLLECSATAQRLPIALQAEFADGWSPTHTLVAVNIASAAVFV